MLERWADEVIELDKARVSTVRADGLSTIVDEFRRLDERVIELAAARVIRACNERRPKTTLGPAGVIQREGMKQRKHMPIRELFSRAGPVVQALKPCFMMTPLTVSQFLPPGFRFDVVIFDEASQVRPSDAVNCIYRGDQLIVAGDEQQLPPTSFFDERFRRRRTTNTTKRTFDGVRVDPQALPWVPAASDSCPCAGTTAASTRT